MSVISSNIETLRTWREKSERNSREVIKLWFDSLGKNVDKLGKEKHLILEQVCLAALDCYHLNIAKTCIELLYEDFPNSLRVKKFESMFFEADEKYEDAMKILDTIITADDTNSAARKRKIAILKAQSKTVEAIKELTDYLKIFMADVEAWQELIELYINEQDFNKAAFCVEELILHSPHNHLLHQRYADIRYTQGGLENFELARSYYCQSIKLNPKNIRALYGLYLSSSAIATSQKSTTQKKKDAVKISEWSLRQIEERYSKEESSLTDRLAALDI